MVLHFLNLFSSRGRGGSGEGGRSPTFRRGSKQNRNCLDAENDMTYALSNTEPGISELASNSVTSSPLTKYINEYYWDVPPIICSFDIIFVRGEGCER